MKNRENPEFSLTAVHGQLYYGKIRKKTAAKLRGATYRTVVQDERSSDIRVHVTRVCNLHYSQVGPEDPATIRFCTDELVYYGAFLQIVHKVTPMKIIATVKFEAEDLYHHVRRFKLE